MLVLINLINATSSNCKNILKLTNTKLHYM